jgi:ribosomal protein S12 methylthiotransferase
LIEKVDITNLPKISFINLGCPKNVVDSEAILADLVENGFYICEEIEDSDIVIVNSCGFLQEGIKETHDVLRQVCKLKERQSIKGVILTGCVPQRLGESILQDVDVDVITGLPDQRHLAKICRKIMDGELERPYISISDDFSNYKQGITRLRITPLHYAYVKIADGCDKTCSFCIIPKIKGKARSRAIEDILQEINLLCQSGAVEIILIAQDTTAYGLDNYKRPMLAELVEKISMVNQVKWIRILYTYPTYITDELIEVISSNPKVVKYLDVPIQHTKDKILKSMQRGISEKEQRELILKLRKRIEGLFLRTTVIVGFPGETEDDFEELLKDIEELRFERLGAFVYSNEPGTPSADFPMQIDQQEKVKRLERLLKVQKKVIHNFNRGVVGKVIDVIIDGYEDKRWVGRTYGDAPEIDCKVYLKAGDVKQGEIKKVLITNFKEYDLVGRVI